ncbi:hypothetical protein KEM55_008582 [Ascosphaera atra]|nr:hypothetical protein KEM55_008582 [Ascosphaera atra]
MAEGVFRHLVKTNTNPEEFTFHIDSAGTSAFHVGDPPDSRTMLTLQSNGINNYRHSGRQLRKSDFTDFDYIMAMDRANLSDILSAREKAVRGLKSQNVKIAEVRLFGDYASQDGVVTKEVGKGDAVPDPYYGGRDGFKNVYQMVSRYSLGFLKYLANQRQGGIN